MIHPVTPWSATVQEDLENTEPLLRKQLSDYSLEIFNAGDSLWLSVAWQSGRRLAFRLAFGMNSTFDKASLTEIDGGILITAATRLASYRVNISFPESDKTILRYTTTMRAKFEMLIPFWPRDIVPITQDGSIENTAGKIHVHQVGGRSGQLFFSYTRPKTGSVFYFQNLTAMSPYCEASETTLEDTVGGEWPEIGFSFPVNKEKPLPANVEYVISDAFVLLADEIPQTDFDVTQQYVDYLAAVYELLPRPTPEYHDWPDIAQKALTDLHQNKGCWTQVAHSAYLNAYLCDYKTPAELMVQLAVLLPLQEYLEWSGEKHPLFDELNSGLEAFYDKRVNTVVRWHPALEDDLDKSEEQKQEMVMDSWYLHHPMLNLCRLALRGDKIAEKLFLESVDYMIKVAHHFNYEWPVFYRMTTLEVLKAETEPGKGGEKDVPGSYAHVMLMAWKLTREKRFLNEATKAVKTLGGLGLDIFYQANNTAFAAGAMAELYVETGDDYYLQMSYCCLAGVFRNVKLWDRDYGYGKHFPHFFAVYPLNDAPYTAAYEELEVYAALYHYASVTEDLPIPASIRMLVAEFVKYAIGRMAYYFPPMLPKEMIADEIKTGEVQNDLWIPLEDIQDGWEKSGSVGQEVYGAGLGFGTVPRQYFKIGESDAIIFIDYPVSGFRKQKQSVTLRTLGERNSDCRLRILNVSKKDLSKFTVEAKSASSYEPATFIDGEYCIPGESMVRVSWK